MIEVEEGLLVEGSGLDVYCNPTMTLAPVRSGHLQVLIVALATLMLLSFEAANLHPAAATSACKYIPFEFSEEAMVRAAEWSEVILIGTVVSSVPSSRTPDFREATIKPEAFLKGQLPGDTVDLTNLGKDCFGSGPPLYEGEHVLLVMRPQTTNGWSGIDPFVGKTVFMDGMAFTDPVEGPAQSLGDVETAIRLWASAADTPPEATNRAILAATGVAPRERDLISVGLLAGGITAVLVTTAIVIWYRRRTEA